MSYVRTKQHREMRAKMIHEWKPWEKSTGPKTDEGKKRSAKRGYKGAVRPMQREMNKAFTEYAKYLKTYSLQQETVEIT